MTFISPGRPASHCIWPGRQSPQSSLRLENALRKEDPWKRACGWQQAHFHLLFLRCNTSELVWMSRENYIVCYITSHCMLSAKWTCADGSNQKECLILKPRQQKGPGPLLKLHIYHCLRNQSWDVRASITLRTSSLISSFKYFWQGELSRTLPPWLQWWDISGRPVGIMHEGVVGGMIIWRRKMVAHVYTLSSQWPHTTSEVCIVPLHLSECVQIHSKTSRRARWRGRWRWLIWQPWWVEIVCFNCLSSPVPILTLRI